MLRKAQFTDAQILAALEGFLKDDLKTLIKTDRRKSQQPVMIKTKRGVKKGH